MKAAPILAAAMMLAANDQALAKGDKGASHDQMHKVSGRESQIGATVTSTIILPTDAMKWTDAPPVLPPGAKIAILDGDMSQKNLFAMRLRLPAGYKIMPHWHPADEHATVISGEFKVGDGDSFDETSMKTLGPGGYFVMPAKHHHFAMTTKETVVQVHGVGPWALTYVNPKDDPRKASR